MAPKQLRSNSGFTLIEVIVVTGLLVLMGGILFGTVGSFIRGRNLVLDGRSNQRTATLFFSRLNRELLSSVAEAISSEALESAGEQSGNISNRRYMLGIDDSGGSTNRDKIRFVSEDSGQAVIGGQSNHGRVEIEYRLVEPEDSSPTQFGEKRRYFYQGLDAGSVVSSGVDLLMGRGAKATAVNDGIVVYSGEMGPFGKTVIIDHGFGLYSLYGFLSSSDVSEGDKVLKSEAIGSPGSTGLNDLVNSVHFEMRLHGLPVRPVEWWDSQWVRDHITNRIQDTKKILGMRTRLPLEKRGL